MSRLLLSLVLTAMVFGLVRFAMWTDGADRIVSVSLPEPGITLLFGMVLVAIAAGVHRSWRQS